MKVQKIENQIAVSNVKKQPNFKRAWTEHASWGANYIKQTGKTNFKLFSFPDAQAVFVEIADKAVSGLSNIKERIVNVLAVAGVGLTIGNITPKDGKTKIYKMEDKGDGIFELPNVKANPNDKYRYIVVTKDNQVNLVKDPYSKKQEGVHSWSTIYNPNNYEWKNTNWLDGKDSRRIIRKPNEPLRGLENLIIEEINIPTLTKEGTFESAKSKIDEIAERGIATAIEIMPVENTYSKQWGYDGVDKFAVNEKLGGADKLKELIDYAHGKGLNVIMDMVPNHMGPDGDYLTQTGPYECGAGQFGAKINYEKANNRYIRDWMVNAALWWANEFKVDGIRFDMTKETASDYLIKQIVDELNYHNPDVFLIAEDGRDNKISVTRYDDNEDPHEDKIETIDMFVDLIEKKNKKSTPQAIGYDSEWDFPLMHHIKSAVTQHNQTALNEIDNLMVNSQYRVKYVMSHDEIGNEDGTRLISKVIAQNLNLFGRIEGYSDADRGQKAAQLAQKLVELVVSKPNITTAELNRVQKEYGLLGSIDGSGNAQFIDKKTIITSIKTALAKQRLAQGTIFTLPGPKMFFQGDENAETGHFKFFRELSSDKSDRSYDPKIKEGIVKEKGYDTLNDYALPDSVLDKIKPAGDFANMQNEMVTYNQDLANLVKTNPALLKGDIVYRYKDHGNLIHIHSLKYGDDEVVVFKNFQDTFYDGNYSTLGFPKKGQWVEIFNSDDKKYGGGDMVNAGRIFSDTSQNMRFAANSIVILKRIS